MKKVTARLEQLSCPSCAELIEKVISREKGVESASVRYASSRLLVTWNPEVIPWEKIAAKIQGLGYSIQEVKINEL